MKVCVCIYTAFLFISLYQFHNSKFHVLGKKKKKLTSDETYKNLQMKYASCFI